VIAERGILMVIGGQFLGSPAEIEAFDSWQADTHVPRMLQLGISSAVRYRLLRSFHTTEESAPRFLALYQFEDAAALEAWASGGLARARAERAGSPKADGFRVTWSGVFAASRSYHTTEDGTIKIQDLQPDEIAQLLSADLAESSADSDES
jgi:hypothetical protein